MFKVFNCMSCMLFVPMNSNSYTWYVKVLQLLIMPPPVVRILPPPHFMRMDDNTDAKRCTRFGSEPLSVEDDVDVWRYATVSCLPETTTRRVGAVKRCFCPSVCLSVAYIVNNSRRRKLVGRYASTDVTGTPVSTSKGQS